MWSHQAVLSTKTNFSNDKPSRNNEIYWLTGKNPALTYFSETFIFSFFLWYPENSNSKILGYGKFQIFYLWEFKFSYDDKASVIELAMKNTILDKKYVKLTHLQHSLFQVIISYLTLQKHMCTPSEITLVFITV